MFKFSKKNKVPNTFKVNSKNTKTTSGASIVKFEQILHCILLFILLNSNKKCWLGLRNSSFRQKIVFSNCEKYIVLWAKKICWLYVFIFIHPTKVWKRINFKKTSRWNFKKISWTLVQHIQKGIRSTSSEYQSFFSSKILNVQTNPLKKNFLASSREVKFLAGNSSIF